ncbi:protocadherin Fat 4-like [Pomacea canaliculata]|uniref:protocadherin Fat 4-like n=1 Tax=Pomacea canaliculata TaxID=400727 RepID=UPI000D73BBA5|nr:protocadherin Fat 4-like [Pomacea canaliculata]
MPSQEDENDHSPKFSPTVYYFTLAETVAPGTVVANLNATDEDSGSNGEIKYRIRSGSRDNFDVDSTTGVMRVANDPSFDYDEYSKYEIQVIATDGGSPQRSANATVFVTVLDTNNKPPTFVQPLYVATVNESTPVGTSVLRVNATDPDAGHSLRYSILAYTIQAQNQQGALVGSVFPYDFRNMFAVDAVTGVIKVSSNLDRKYVVETTFDVQCTDINGVANLPQSGTSRVTISISGTQDVTLQFDNNVVYITVSENQPTDKKIYTVQARDPANGFRVVNNYEKVPGTDPNSIFQVSQSNGEVYLSRQLNYDAGERDFSVQIRALDGTRSATVTLSIRYTSPYRVGVISAQDGDSATFGPIEYILGLGLNSDDFELITQPSGDGVLQVRNPLDYETRKVYYLTVIGIDNPYLRGSAVRKSSSVSVTVSVLDVNDNAPTFRDTTKNFSIPATAAVGFPVSKIEAFDLDEGINGEIVYSLQATNDNEALSWFTISETGVLQTKAPFSAQNKRFDLKVVATDKGTPSLSSALPITIKIQGTEDDDGTPQWYNFVNNFVAQAPEHEPNYTLSLRATATPRTPGAVSVYGLVPFGQDYQSFSVDPKTGAIVVKADLDREKQENYTLIISATDSLNSTLISRRTLIVNLLDKNDNFPTFAKTNYSACPTAFEVPTVVYADDNTPVHTIVAYAKACDPDSAPYNRMSYELYTGNNSGTFLCNSFNSGAFNVNPNGSIENTRMLDYEERQEYLVCVTVLPATSSNRRNENLIPV